MLLAEYDPKAPFALGHHDVADDELISGIRKNRVPL